MQTILSLLSAEQKQRALKQYSIPVRDASGTVVSFRCFDGGDFWYEVFKDKTGNYEKNSLTISDVLQLAGLPVTFDDMWNIIITPEIELYYMEISDIMDMNDTGQLRSWRNIRGLLNNGTTGTGKRVV